jgi:hypothetical protein
MPPCCRPLVLLSIACHCHGSWLDQDYWTIVKTSVKATIPTWPCYLNHGCLHMPPCFTLECEEQKWWTRKEEELWTRRYINYILRIAPKASNREIFWFTFDSLTNDNFNFLKNSIVTVILLVHNLLGGSLILQSTSWSGCWLVTISQEATIITSAVSRRKQKGVTSKWRLLLRCRGFNDIYIVHSILTQVMSILSLL